MRVQQQVENSGPTTALSEKPFPVQLIREHLPFIVRAPQAHLFIPSLLQVVPVSIIGVAGGAVGVPAPPGRRKKF